MDPSDIDVETLEPSAPDTDPSPLDTDPSPLDTDPSPLNTDPSTPISSSQPHTVSVACRQQNLINTTEKQRSRKPSTPRRKQPTSVEQLDDFLARGCRCASNCCTFFNKDHYLLKQDEASSLSKEELDMVVLGQIQAFLCMDNTVGPSHKHTPTQRKLTRVNTFYHLGRRICRATFLALHGIGKNQLKYQLKIVH